jgi:hypothetical protein
MVSPYGRLWKSVYLTFIFVDAMVLSRSLSELYYIIGGGAGCNLQLARGAYELIFTVVLDLITRGPNKLATF